MRFFGVNFIPQKFCSCKKNDKYQVWWCIKFFHLRLIDGKNYCVGIIPKSHFAILDGTKSYFFKLWIIHQKTVLRTTPKKEQQTKSPPRQIRKSRNLSKSLGSENIHATSYSCRQTSMLNGGQEKLSLRQILS